MKCLDVPIRPLDLPSNATHVVTYAYDHQGRMVSKVIDGAPRTYLWDGYNIISETVPLTSPNALTNYYAWGLDLSGTLQGAGGVGGLLAVTCVSSDTSNAGGARNPHPGPLPEGEGGGNNVFFITVPRP